MTLVLVRFSMVLCGSVQFGLCGSVRFGFVLFGSDIVLVCLEPEKMVYFCNYFLR